MKVTLACPSDWFERPGLGDAGETVDVDDQEGVRLVREGYARVHASSLTADNVDQAAALAGVDVSDASTVTEKKSRVRAAQQEG